MSMPTIVRFQIAVPSTDGNGEATDKVYTLTLSLLVEGGCEDGGIKVTPLLETSASSTDGESDILPGSGVMPIEDPPKPAPATN